MHPARPPCSDITFAGVAKAVDLGRKPVGIDTLDDPIPHIPAARPFQVGDILPRQTLWIVPPEDLGQAAARLRTDRGL